ncbi:MAG: MraY family glycosyltransferase [bacterium]
MLEYLNYLAPFIIAFLLSVILTPLIHRWAIKKGIVDIPNEPRKIHQKSVPLLGGWAVFGAFVLTLLFYTFFTERVLGGFMLLKFVAGIVLAGLVLMLGGYLDDKYKLKPSRQIIFPIIAVLIIIASGIGVEVITNPLGGFIHLDKINIKFFSYNNLPYQITLGADLFALIWLLGLMYTTKFLDGLDGLVSGVTTIGALIIFFLCLHKEVAQPETALLAMILAGAFAGFLLFNWHPAKIFLGEGGGLFAGLMLGVLAIIAGGKIATALLIMGVPILDVIWVIARRVFFEHKSPYAADKKHLHFRLLDVGLSHRGAVLTLYFITAAFGVTSLFLQTRQKLWALMILLFLMVGLAMWLVWRYKRKSARD